MNKQCDSNEQITPKFVFTVVEEIQKWQESPKILKILKNLEIPKPLTNIDANLKELPMILKISEIWIPYPVYQTH